MRKMLWVIIAFIMLGFPAIFVTSQENTNSPRIEITGINPSDTPTILITANVYDSLGQPVRGLGVSDFTLSGQLAEQGSIVTVENLADDNLPFAVVLVIDTSSSMAGRPLELVQDAASLFVESLSDIDTVALVTFDSDVTVVQDFTTDKGAVLAAIDSVFFGGRTALYDAAVAGVEVGANAPVPRRAMILLSDGAEFGGISSAAREAGLAAARASGVPVYTIGLGFGTDRSYLEELASGTNARFYESPTPEELEDIYTSLADLFRSQYVITINADVPLDGTEYPFTLKASTGDGETNTVAGVVRAPIPVPVVIAPPAPGAPIDQITTFTFDVRADNELSSVEASLNGEVLTSFTEAPYSVELNPFTLAPGDYELTVTATDVDGDTGSGTVAFAVSALPSVISLGTDLSAAGEIAEPIELVLSIEGQTPTEQVTFSVDGVEQTVLATSDEYRFTLDPFNYSSGEHTLTVEVLSSSGAVSSIDVPFMAANLPPRLSFETFEAPLTVNESRTLDVIIQTQGDVAVESVQVTIGDVEVPVNVGDNSAEITLNPLDLPPGENTLSINVTDANGANLSAQLPIVVTALAPDVTVEGITEGDVIEDVTDVVVTVAGQTPASAIVFSVDNLEVSRAANSPATLTLDPLSFEPGAHTLQITVTNQGGQTIVLPFGFEFSMSPYLTATPPTPTPTIDVSATAEFGTLVAVQTQNAEATQTANDDATATTEAEVQATVEAEETQSSAATGTIEAEVQATVDAEETQSAAATGTIEAEVQATLEAEETQSAEATGTAEIEMQLTIDAQATTEAESDAITQMTITAEVAAIATLDAQTMLNEQATADAEATTNAAATLEERATEDAEATEVSAVTLEAAAALQATDTESPTEAPTDTNVPTEAPTDTESPTEAPTDTESPTEAPTDTEAPTEEPTDEATSAVIIETIEPTATQFDPTSTPTGELTDIQTGTPPDESNLPVIVIAVVLALLLILIVILFSRRRE